MRPIELTLEGFGSYQKPTTIYFTPQDAPDKNAPADDLSLFLVSGATGSGKTTIFDAMTFALYGEVNADKGRSGLDLLTRDATDSKKPPKGRTPSKRATVRFVFDIGHGSARRRYTVTRSVKRGKSSGEWNTTPEVSFECPGEPPRDKAEANAAIVKAIGLSKEQFKQLAMLAQGEFMRLLRTSSKARGEIFRTLFGTEDYEKIETELESRRKQCDKEMERWWDIASDLCEKVLIPDDCAERDMLLSLRAKFEETKAPLPDLCEDMQAALEKLTAAEQRTVEEEKATAAALDVQAKDAAGALEQAKQLAADIQSEKNHSSKLAELNAQKREMDNKRELVASLRKAYELKRVHESVFQTQDSVKHFREALAAETEKLPGLQKTAHDLQIAAAKSHEAQNKDRARNEEIQARANTSIEHLKNVERAEKNLKQARQDEQSAVQRKSEIAGRRKALQEQIQNAQKEMAGLANAEQERAECRTLGEKLRESETLCKECIAKELEWQEADTAKTAAHGAYTNQLNEYAAAETRLYNGYAGLLAAKLEAGEPCPVCGSTEHPHLHVAEESTPTRAQVDKLKKAADKLEQEWRALETNALQLQAQFREKQSILQAQLPKLLPSADPHAPLTELKTHLADEIKKKIAEYNAYDAKVKRSAKLDADVRKAQETDHALEEELTEAVSLEAASRSRMEEAAAQIQEARAAAAYSTIAEAEKVKKESRAQLDTFVHAQEQADRAKAEADKAADVCEHAIQTHKANLDRSTEAAAKAESDYQAKLTEKKLSEAQWKTLVHAHAEAKIEEYEAAVRTYDREYHSTTAVLEDIRTRIGGRPEPDLASLETTSRAIEEKQRDAHNRLVKTQSALDAHMSSLSQLSEKLEERSDLSKRADVVRSLADRISGKTSGQRVRLETFVQRTYFESILAAANHRLDWMTSGEFALRLLDLDSAGSGRTDTGLELRAFNRLKGTELSIEAVSGGEKFMMALALALGMCDVIERESSAVHLEMMFIDEGFGSLDDTARRKTVSALQHITEGNKMIGVISHVGELKEQIDAQLEVTKDDNGSHAVWK